MKDLSLAIVGGGLGGLATATTLSRIGLDVTISEQARASPASAGGPTLVGLMVGARGVASVFLMFAGVSVVGGLAATRVRDAQPAPRGHRPLSDPNLIGFGHVRHAEGDR